MCTVTYLPNANGNYILTSSRDESIVRPAAIAPQEYKRFGKTIIFPQDPQAGGTWIAYSENRTACLLNGGFKKHIHTPPYKKSRGLVLLDYFSFGKIKEFSEAYDFSGIEPFTLVLVESGKLFELRWDSQKIHFLSLDSSLPHIWSSVTLYSEETILKRTTWFQHWLEAKPVYLAENIRSFHRNAGEGNPETNVLMNKNNYLKTVSITTIEKKDSSVEIIYEDLTNNAFLSKEVILTEL